MARTPPIQQGPLKLLHATLEPAVDQVMRPLLRAVEQLQAAGGLIHENVTLAEDAETTIAHKLGKLPVFVYVSPPRNAVALGRIGEVRYSTVDRSKFVVLEAYGWGADIVVDIWFMAAG